MSGGGPQPPAGRPVGEYAMLAAVGAQAILRLKKGLAANEQSFDISRQEAEGLVLMLTELTEDNKRLRGRR